MGVTRLIVVVISQYIYISTHTCLSMDMCIYVVLHNIYTYLSVILYILN